MLRRELGTAEYARLVLAIARDVVADHGLPAVAAPPMTSHRLGLVGAGIDKSLAPAFHELAGEMLGLDVTYELLPQAPQRSSELDEILRDLAARATTA